VDIATGSGQHETGRV